MKVLIGISAVLALFIAVASRAEVLPDPLICAGPEFKVARAEERPYGKEAKWGIAAYE